MKTYSLISIFISIAILLSSTTKAEDASLWHSLKQGGLVLLMSHTAVPTGEQSNKSLVNYDPTCESERLLSAQGKEEAKTIAHNIIQHGIQFEEVLNSPYCRTQDTAKIAFSQYRTEDYLRLWIPLSMEIANLYQDKLVQKISQYSGKGNLAIITHSPNVASISFDTLKSGHALVVKPKGDEEFEELGLLPLF